MAFGSSKKTDTEAGSVSAPVSDGTPSATVSETNSLKDVERPQTASSSKDVAAVPTDGQVPSDSSKLRTFLGILKRFIGVSDMAAVRFSLPAQLLEPIPNLEYWHYLDRPETFAAIGDSDDPLERMLHCLRFWFTKDLKYVKGKPCKPYNSALGEFFRCSWEVQKEEAMKTVGTAQQPVKVHYLTEQTSHHPPVSAFVYDCPEKGVSAVGYDQLSAKFTGTSVKVTPGAHNQGIFITLRQRDNEEYRLTHPAAFLGGFLRGNLYITVADTCFVTCEKTGLKTILHYLEEGYFGKTQNKVEGIVYKPSSVLDDKVTRLKDVPSKEIIGRIEGVWTEKIWFVPGSADFKKSKESERILLMDVSPLLPIPKKCPPEDQQLPNESRKFWGGVTDAIVAKQYGQATQRKTELEERQRERAAERAKEGKEWSPRFFTTVTEKDGRPRVSEVGKKAMEGLQAGDYTLEKPAEYGAI
ncbi:oxysterol-binding protein [Zymoseptoria brevis]|uniref:Oxysterol-binding protein n=1 Tax=Zymoseptoria brevis TaxID=1047168 RepID=A0A0F4GIN0_9PEZI|nr:oxysterol-binding protein [Zymoseptoria brevis]